MLSPMQTSYTYILLLQFSELSNIIKKNINRFEFKIWNNHRQFIQDPSTKLQKFTFINQVIFINHLVIEEVMKKSNTTNAQILACEICHIQFNSIYNYNKHKSTHTKIPLVCSQCGQVFFTNYNLKRHVAARHYKIKTHTCMTCKQSFNRRADLLRHAIKHNQNNKKYKCNICGKQFSRKDMLGRHAISCSDK